MGLQCGAQESRSSESCIARAAPQLTPVARTLFCDTELTLVGHVAFSLGIPHDASFKCCCELALKLILSKTRIAPARLAGALAVSMGPMGCLVAR